MKIRNTLKTLPNYALPRMLHWVCEQLSLPFAGVHMVEFNATTKTWAGRVIFKERKIVTSINTNAKFPLTLKNKATEQPETVHNELELLVYATAANLAYLREYWEMSFIKVVSQPHVPQNSVDKRAFEILNAFREQQSDLVTRWNIQPPAGFVAADSGQTVEQYKEQVKQNNAELEKLRVELEGVKKQANTIRDKMHKLHVRNGYCARAMAKVKTKGSEWTVPDRFVLMDSTAPPPPGTENRQHDGQTIVVE